MAKSLLPFDDLLQTIDDNPIDGAKQAQRRHKSVRVARYESSVSAFALARRLQGDEALMSAFYSLPFFSEPVEGAARSNKKNPKLINLHAHQYVYEARDGSEGKAAEDHASATQPSFDDETVAPEALLEMLKIGGGFDGLRKAVKQPTAKVIELPARAPTRSMPAGSGRQPSLTDEDDGDEDQVQPVGAGRGKRPHTPDRGTADDDKPQKRRPLLTMKQVLEHLLITLEPSELDVFLEPLSDVGDRYRLIIERDDDGPGGRVIWRLMNRHQLQSADACAT